MTSRVPRRRFGVQRGSRSDRGSYACVVWCSAPEDEAWGEGWVWDGVRIRLGVRVRARLGVRAGGAGGGDRVGDALELEGGREHRRHRRAHRARHAVRADAAQLAVAHGVERVLDVGDRGAALPQDASDARRRHLLRGHARVRHRLHGQRRRNGRLWRRLARAAEAVVGHSVGPGLFLGVPSCPEPPGAPLGGAGAELGLCQKGAATTLTLPRCRTISARLTAVQAATWLGLGLGLGVGLGLGLG